MINSQNNSLTKRWWLYILKLENEKWYVGITTKNPEDRFQEHIARKRGAYWTMKHKPISIELTEDLGLVSRPHAENYENEVTRSLMKERGLNNVRGGDLRDEEEYIQRFGYLMYKDWWDVIVYVVLLNLIILWLVMDKYGWNLVVFGAIILGVVAVWLILRKFNK